MFRNRKANPHNQNQFAYIFRQSIWQIITGLCLFLIFTVCLLYNFNKGIGFSEQWGSWLEPFSTISLILISLTIWYNEKKENWINSLPKKLDIIYRLDGNVFCTVQNAPLTNEGDIRQWGQSIAKSILKNDRVNIPLTGFDIIPQGYLKKEKIVKYRLTIYIREEIKGITKGQTFEFDGEGRLLHQHRQDASTEA